MDFLTDTERQYIEEDAQRKRAVALGRLSELAVTITSIDAIAEAMRVVDPDKAHKIGKAARDAVVLLRSLGVHEIVREGEVTLEVAVSAPEAEVELPQNEVSEPVADVVAAVVEDEATQTVEIVREEAVILHPAATPWLVKIFGDDWCARLGVEVTDDEEAIAKKALIAVPPKSQKSYDEFLQRIVMRLRGSSALAIEEVTGTKPTALTQYERTLRLRFEKSDVSENEEVQQLEASVIEEGQEATTQHAALTALPTPPLPRPPVSPRPLEVVAKPEVNEALTHHELASKLRERLDLDSTAEVSLRGFLDPKSTGDMTAAKERAVEAVTDYLRPLLDEGGHELTPEEVRWVRKCFGIFTKNEVPENLPPVPLKELRRDVRQAEQAARVDAAVLGGLEKLLNQASHPEADTLRGSDFVKAALQPEKFTSEQFAELRAELRDLLDEKFGSDFSEEIFSALESGTVPGRTVDVSKRTRDAFARLRQLVMAREKATTGWVKIDRSLRQFISAKHSPTGVTVAIPKDEREQFERNVIAGIYIYTRSDDEEAAA